MKKEMYRDAKAQDAFRDGVAHAKLSKDRKLDSRFERLGKALLLSDYHYDLFELASDPSKTGGGIGLELHEVDFSYLETIVTHPWIDLYAARRERRPEEHHKIWSFADNEYKPFWQVVNKTMKNVRSENGRYNFYFELVDEHYARGYVENQIWITRDTLFECAHAFARRFLNVDIPTSRMFFVHHENIYDWYDVSNGEVADSSKLESGLLDAFRRYHPDVLKELGFDVDDKPDVETLVLEGVMKLQAYLNGQGCDFDYFSRKIGEICDKQGEDIAIEYCKSIKRKCGFFPLVSKCFAGTLARVLSAAEKT